MANIKTRFIVEVVSEKIINRSDFQDVLREKLIDTHHSGGEGSEARDDITINNIRLL